MKNIIKNILDQSYTNHSMIIGKSDTTKSLITKSIIDKNLKEGRQVIIWDFKGEYKDFCMNRNGTYIDFTKECPFNPFHLPLNTLSLTQHLLDCLKLFELSDELFSTDDKRKKMFIVLEQLFLLYGFNRHTNKEPITGDCPTFSEFVNCLSFGEKKILNKALPYFSSSEPFKIETPLTVFSFDPNHNYLNMLLFASLGFVKKQQSYTSNKHSFLIDDADLLLNNTIIVDFICMSLKVAKKWGTEFHLNISNAARSFAYGEGVFNSIQNFLFLTMSEEDISLISKTFYIPSENLKEITKKMGYLSCNGVETSIYLPNHFPLLR